MFWSSSSRCTALYCYARSALRWSISGFVGIRTGRGRMKLSSARCRARFSKEYICPTSGSRRTTRRGARDHSCIGSISESIRGHSMNWGRVEDDRGSQRVWRYRWGMVEGVSTQWRGATHHHPARRRDQGHVCARPDTAGVVRRLPGDNSPRRVPAAGLHQGRLIGGTTTWNPGRSSCTVDPSVNNMSKPQNPTGSRTRG